MPVSGCPRSTHRGHHYHCCFSLLEAVCARAEAFHQCWSTLGGALLSGLKRRLCSCPANGCGQLAHPFPGQLTHLPAGSHPPVQVPNTCQLAQTPQPRDWSQESQCFLHSSQGLSLALHRTGCLCHLLRGLLPHTLLPPPSVLSWS